MAISVAFSAIWRISPLLWFPVEELEEDEEELDSAEGRLSFCFVFFFSFEDFSDFFSSDSCCDCCPSVEAAGATLSSAPDDLGFDSRSEHFEWCSRGKSQISP